MKIPVLFTNFFAGQSPDVKFGAAGSHGYGQHMDFRKNSSQMSVLPQPAKESGTAVIDLVVDMLQLGSGKIVAIGDAGNVYTRTTGGTWTAQTALPDTAFGMVYNQQHDTIYVPGLHALHAITGADGLYSGSSFTVTANAISAQVDQSATSHANTYTTPSSISEATLDKLVFTPTLDPIHSLKLWVTAKGTGGITVTVHDAANNVLGTATLAAGAITISQLNEFVFATPIRIYIGSTYHVHVTYDSSGAKTASTLGAATSGDFSTGQFEQWSDRFVNPQNGFHPAIEFLQYLCFGNERYLAVWEPISQSAPSATEFQQHRLTFPSGFQTTSLDIWNEFLAIGVEKRSSNATSEFQDGRIYLWDGTSSTYNTIIPIPEGSPNSLFSAKNILYWFAGGSWWAYSGGLPVKIFQMPGTDTEYLGSSFYLRTYPKAMTMRNSIMLAAFPSDTSAQTIEHAVYSFGSRDKNSPESFGFSYTPSHNTILYDGSHPLRIGMVKNFGSNLFISWQNNLTYGVDAVNPTSKPATNFSWESLIDDTEIISARRRYSRADKTKEAVRVIMVTKPLPTGFTITPKYKIDRESSWENDASFTITAGQNQVELPVNKRYREFQFGFDGVNDGSGTTSPEILSVGYVTESLGSEGD